jgi:hypothetical protein
VDGLAQHNTQAAAPVADPRAAAIDAAAKHDQLRAMSEEVKSLRTLIQKSGQQQPQNVKVSVDSDAMEKSVQNFHKIADNTLKQIREDIQNMPIVIPAPSVTVEAIMPELKQINPTVNVYNDVKPSEVTVIDNHPKRAVQVVERDGNDEILRTITTYEAK